MSLDHIDSEIAYLRAELATLNPRYILERRSFEARLADLIKERAQMVEAQEVADELANDTSPPSRVYTIEELRAELGVQSDARSCACLSCARASHGPGCACCGCAIG